MFLFLATDQHRCDEHHGMKHRNALVAATGRAMPLTSTRLLPPANTRRVLCNYRWDHHSLNTSLTEKRRTSTEVNGRPLTTTVFLI
jgi:hypothetical protein